MSKPVGWFVSGRVLRQMNAARAPYNRVEDRLIELLDALQWRHEPLREEHVQMPSAAALVVAARPQWPR